MKVGEKLRTREKMGLALISAFSYVNFQQYFKIPDTQVISFHFISVPPSFQERLVVTHISISYHLFLIFLPLNISTSAIRGLVFSAFHFSLRSNYIS